MGDTRRIQELGGKLLATNQRELFQKWLNFKASEDEKLLTKAAFTSLNHYLKNHSDHSMPWLIQYLATFPLVGGFFTWAYKKQHDFWQNAKAKRNRKLSSGSRISGSATPETSILETSSRARNFVQSKSDAIAKKMGGLGSKKDLLSGTRL